MKAALTIKMLIEWLEKFPQDATVSAGSEHQSGEIAVWGGPGVMLGRASSDGHCYGPKQEVVSA